MFFCDWKVVEEEEEEGRKEEKENFAGGICKVFLEFYLEDLL